MRAAPIVVFLCLNMAAPSQAHENETHTSTQGDLTCLSSNSMPDHETGKFPNRANPNSLDEQDLTFCFPSEPKLSTSVTRGEMTVGVSVTGVPMRPYTAGYYDPNGRRGISQNSASGWRQQAMHNPRSLGMDDQNAHVDRSGLYHYHAVSEALVAQHGNHIGYAPDGFKIYDSRADAASSWQLKSGTRPSGPGGAYDGTFEEDFEYVAGSGTLDECNGAMVDGTYTYFATDSYPYFPRCYRGETSGRFMTRAR
jgi:hypothetical protein